MFLLFFLPSFSLSITSINSNIHEAIDHEIFFYKLNINEVAYEHKLMIIVWVVKWKSYGEKTTYSCLINRAISISLMTHSLSATYKCDLKQKMRFVQ